MLYFVKIKLRFRKLKRSFRKLRFDFADVNLRFIFLKFNSADRSFFYLVIIIFLRIFLT